MVKSPTQAFAFRRLDTIGVADAEADDAFLSECFVDTGNLSILRDCKDPRRILLGRTGSGKSALLRMLQDAEGERVIIVPPESLALPYISNSTILRFLADLGVKLDIFFKLLWRHVFAIEVLRAHFNIRTPDGRVGFWDRLRALLDPVHRRAIDYLEKWGSSFWEETDYRIKEVTTTLETQLKASIGTEKLSPIVAGVTTGSTLSEQEKAEIVTRAQSVVNAVQIKELSGIIDLLADATEGDQKRYYVVIDRLDENWIEDRLRYPLIRALIETVRDFLKAKNVKLIVAFRYDLLDRVFSLTRDAGFQEEKYESHYLDVNWTKAQLADVVDLRLNSLIKGRFANVKIKHTDVLPKLIDQRPALDYLLGRTMLRPRDIILFMNSCISRAADRPRITTEMILDAEGEHSRDRMRSMCDEWAADYPSLAVSTRLLRNRASSFPVAELSSNDLANMAVEVVGLPASPEKERDDLAKGAASFVDGTSTPEHFAKIVAHIFYRTGLVGLKLQAHETTIWTTSGRRSISWAEVGPETKIAVHPCFWRTLGIRNV